MIDPKYLRQQIEETAARLSKRGYALEIDLIKSLEEQRKVIQTETQHDQNERNTLSKQIGMAKAKGQDVAELMEKANGLIHLLTQREEKLKEIQKKLLRYYLQIPNFLDESVPPGTSEEENVSVREWGTPRVFGFEPKDHVDLGTARGWLDFDAAGKIAGARFVVMYGPLAKLQRALIRFMMDVHTAEHGYQEVYVPYLVNEESLYGTSQLPKFAADQFEVKSEQGLYLVPTAEVPVTNLARDVIFEAEALPIKYVCHTPCFRSEAGSYGKDTRGMIRQHQFEKVELVQLVTPAMAIEAHEALTRHAESILQKLELPYRVMLLCAGDTGFASAKTYDLEVWLPGQQKYREISSCSYFSDFQARRMQARYRVSGKPEFIHTINGSGLAVGRTLVAILENCQDKEGRIHLPKVLWPYMDGVQIL